MRAVLIKAYGDASTLAVSDIDSPALGPHDIRFKVAAAGVNHVDMDVRNGVAGIEHLQSLPHIMGVDCAGVVSDVGDRVTLWKVGDRVTPHFILNCGRCDTCRAHNENMCSKGKVLGLTAWGGYAENVVVEERHCVAVPEGLKFEDCIAGLTPFATSWEALVVTAKLTAGETVLVTGAGGGVGSHAVQVARLCGAEVIAAVGTDEKAERIKELGAHHTINYKNEDLAEGVKRLTNGRGVDVAIDGIGGAVLKGCINAVAEGGRIASIGAHGGEVVDIDMIALFRKHVSLLGCGRSTLQIYETVMNMMARGVLKPIIHAEFPLEKAGDAHKVVESRDFFGRIILKP